jgi:hypothetical protein
VEQLVEALRYKPGGRGFELQVNTETVTPTPPFEV